MSEENSKAPEANEKPVNQIVMSGNYEAVSDELYKFILARTDRPITAVSILRAVADEILAKVVIDAIDTRAAVVQFIDAARAMGATGTKQ